MTLRERLSVAFVVVMLVPLLAVSFVSAWEARRVLEESTGSHIANLAREKANGIAFIIQDRINEAAILSAAHEVLQAVRDANAAYDGRDETEVRRGIHELDAEWIASKEDGGSEKARAVLDSSASAFLKRHQARNTGRYGEIFLTDGHGAAIAQTRILSDYDQSDEGWWQACYDAGRGAVFLEDRGLDVTVGELVMGVSVPVMDSGKVAGVLKIAYRVKDVLEVVEGAGTQTGIAIQLVRSLGMVLAQSGAAHSDSLTESEKSALEGNETSYTANDYGGTRYLMGYCPVAMDISTRISTPGDRKGISGERWEPSQWWIFVQVPRAIALAPLVRFAEVSLAGALVALVCSVILAFVVASSMSRPFRKLQADMRIIGGGDIDHRVGMSSKDEIGELSRAIDDMLEHIAAVTASRDELNAEVAQRRRAEVELARSNRDLEAFGYSASHDLQEPLRKIVAFSDLVVTGCGDQLDELHRGHLERVQNAARRMQKLISGLLMYSRVTTKAKPFEPVDLADTVSGVVADLEVRIAETGAEIHVDGLPVLDAEPVQMRQLLQNLIGNALKFKREKVAPRIEVTGEILPAEGVQEAMCRIVVRDNGIGFDPKFADRIFKVFQRLHGRNAYEGTGIGLALCQKIVDRHNGTISVDSVPGEGSTFTVTLPMQQPAQAGVSTAG